MTNNSNDKGMGAGMLLFIGVIVVTILSAMFNGNSNTQSTYTTAPSTPERRYVEGRFRAEGFSDKDSKTAADAVLKFHEAQKNR